MTKNASHLSGSCGFDFHESSSVRVSILPPTPCIPNVNWRSKDSLRCFQGVPRPLLTVMAYKKNSPPAPHTKRHNTVLSRRSVCTASLHTRLATQVFDGETEVVAPGVLRYGTYLIEVDVCIVDDLGYSRSTPTNGEPHQYTKS